MDHLMRVQDEKNSKCNHPPKCDLLNLHIDYILDCKIDGEWNVSNERSNTFSLKTHTQIYILVEQMSFTKS